MTQRRLALMGVCVFASLSCSVSDSTGVEEWSWIGAGEGTYWYVPEESLQAITWDPYSPSDYTFIDDQTVWHIEYYDNGYLAGPVVVKFEGYPRSCQYMIGSVAPDGEVHVSFTSLEEMPSITTGTGHMVREEGSFAFSMQMASGNASVQVAHWAIMRKCTPDQDCWDDIPGSDATISELLASCE